MRSHRIRAIITLFILAVLFAISNLWFAAARSTIPLELDTTVVDRQRLFEKSRGVDDVFLMTLESGRRIQVDRHVYEAVNKNDSIEKPSWARRLKVNDHNHVLKWSQDYRGMVWVMPAAIGLSALVGMAAAKNR